MNINLIKRIILVLGVLIFAGLVQDFTNGFAILKNSDPTIVVIGNLLLIGAAYTISEGIFSKLGVQKSEIFPIWKRALRILVIVITALLIILYTIYIGLIINT